VPELPHKEFFKLSEVCQATDTQPYVLRFWESEFPQLNPERTAGGQSLYRKADVELVQRIKELLYDEDFTLESAREQLTEEGSAGAKREAEPRSDSSPSRQEASVPAHAPSNGDASARTDVISRRRYEDAVDEIDHLRMALKEAEKKLRRAESDLEQSIADGERDRGRAERALAHLENLRRLLSEPSN
jgi:DNA-binding transcriptional MerR regulator